MMDRRILLVGEDFHLLASRAALLSKTGARVTCCNTAEFADHLGTEKYALVVLCHSLRQDVGSGIAGEAHKRWPTIRVLQVVSTYNRPAHLPAGVDGSTPADPGKVLEHVIELLRPSMA